MKKILSLIFFGLTIFPLSKAMLSNNERPKIIRINGYKGRKNRDITNGNIIDNTQTTHTNTENFEIAEDQYDDYQHSQYYENYIKNHVILTEHIVDFEEQALFINPALREDLTNLKEKIKKLQNYARSHKTMKSISFLNNNSGIPILAKKIVTQLSSNHQEKQLKEFIKTLKKFFLTCIVSTEAEKRLLNQEDIITIQKSLSYIKDEAVITLSQKRVDNLRAKIEESTKRTISVSREIREL